MDTVAVVAATRWERLKVVALTLGVQNRTLRRWVNEGWVSSRRLGPKLTYVLVHAEGPLAGQPVGLEDSVPPGDN